MLYCSDFLDGLSRRELQSLAKQHGLKANGKTIDLLAALKEIVDDSPSKRPPTPKKVRSPVPSRNFGGNLSPVVIETPLAGVVPVPDAPRRFSFAPPMPEEDDNEENEAGEELEWVVGTEPTIDAETETSAEDTAEVLVEEPKMDASMPSADVAIEKDEDDVAIEKDEDEVPVEEDNGEDNDDNEMKMDNENKGEEEREEKEKDEEVEREEEEEMESVGLADIMLATEPSQHVKDLVNTVLQRTPPPKCSAQEAPNSELCNQDVGLRLSIALDASFMGEIDEEEKQGHDSVMDINTSAMDIELSLVMGDDDEVAQALSEDNEEVQTQHRDVAVTDPVLKPVTEHKSMSESKLSPSPKPAPVVVHKPVVKSASVPVKSSLSRPDAATKKPTVGTKRPVAAKASGSKAVPAFKKTAAGLAAPRMTKAQKLRAESIEKRKSQMQNALQRSQQQASKVLQNRKMSFARSSSNASERFIKKPATEQPCPALKPFKARPCPNFQQMHKISTSKTMTESNGKVSHSVPSSTKSPLRSPVVNRGRFSASKTEVVSSCTKSPLRSPVVNRGRFSASKTEVVHKGRFSASKENANPSSVFRSPLSANVTSRRR